MLQVFLSLQLSLDIPFRVSGNKKHFISLLFSCNFLHDTSKRKKKNVQTWCIFIVSFLSLSYKKVSGETTLTAYNVFKKIKKVNKKCSVGVTAIWSWTTGAAAARVWGTAAAAEPRGAWASFLWDQRERHSGYRIVCIYIPNQIRKHLRNELNACWLAVDLMMLINPHQL